MAEHTPTPWVSREAVLGNIRHTPVTYVEAKLPCINGLSALFTIATLYQSDVAEIQMSDGLKAHGEDDAAFIVKCVNSHAALVTELKLIADWRNVNLAGEYEHSLRDVIRSMLDCADRALSSFKEK